MTDPTLGEIWLFAGDFAPVGWHVCNGTLVDIAANEQLHRVLGTRYGGDGHTTFALPMLTGPSGLLYLIAVEGTFPHHP